MLSEKVKIISKRMCKYTYIMLLCLVLLIVPVFSANAHILGMLFLAVLYGNYCLSFITGVFFIPAFIVAVFYTALKKQDMAEAFENIEGMFGWCFLGFMPFVMLSLAAYFLGGIM